MARDHVIQVRVTADEAAGIIVAARSEGRSVSAWARRRLVAYSQASATTSEVRTVTPVPKSQSTR